MTKKLKIDIISSLPAFARYKGKGETGIIRGPNLTLPHLAALTPGIDDDVEVRITDELCETINMDTPNIDEDDKLALIGEKKSVYNLTEVNDNLDKILKLEKSSQAYAYGNLYPRLIKDLHHNRIV